LRGPAYRGNFSAPIGYGRFHAGVGRHGDFRGFGARGHPWHGGYWGGRYWPPFFWGVGLAWFLPVLPAYCPVYWWNDVPYYYYDNAYYTWDQDDAGYVTTAPPPAVPDDSSAGTAADGSGAPGNLYAYPKNGQSPQQQAQDRQACEQWAATQTHGDEGTAADGGNGAPGDQSIDYQRAVTACLTGRGYSVD
jgi:hypothetical protein